MYARHMRTHNIHNTIIFRILLTHNTHSTDTVCTHNSRTERTRHTPECVDRISYVYAPVSQKWCVDETSTV